MPKSMDDRLWSMEEAVRLADALRSEDREGVVAVVPDELVRLRIAVRYRRLDKRPRQKPTSGKTEPAQTGCEQSAASRVAVGGLQSLERESEINNPPLADLVDRTNDRIRV